MGACVFKLDRKAHRVGERKPQSNPNTLSCSRLITLDRKNLSSVSSPRLVAPIRRIPRNSIAHWLWVYACGGLCSQLPLNQR
jgi:hypothetical protein